MVVNGGKMAGKRHKNISRRARKAYHQRMMGILSSACLARAGQGKSEKRPSFVQMTSFGYPQAGPGSFFAFTQKNRKDT